MKTIKHLLVLLALLIAAPSAALAQDSDQATAIRETVRAHTPEVRMCYESALADAPDLEGKVEVRFTINPDGTVSGSEVAASSLQSAVAERCVLSAVDGWRFPTQADGPTVVRYPFRFSLAAPEEEGTIDPGAVREVMRAARPSFKRCYETTLLHNPRLETRATLEFVVAADGEQQRVKMNEPGTGDAELDACLLSVAGALSMPHPEGGPVTIHYPLTFNPAQ